jgi:hypothetical protein
LKNEQNQLSREQELEILQQTTQLKKTLKQLSKNQLIALVLQQVNLTTEQQNINRILLDQIKESEKENENV